MSANKICVPISTAVYVPIDVGVRKVIALWLFYRNAHRIGQELDG